MSANLGNILLTIVDPTFGGTLPAWMDTKAARVMLLAIGLQESRFATRQQIGGPARSYFQFEKGGGIQGVLTHHVTRPYAEKACWNHKIDATAQAVYDAMLEDDILGCAFARLLLYSDPNAIPERDAQAGWDFYQRNWRPGAPHRATWDAFYAQATTTVA